jgi:SAM-dependent methyltransferase
VDIIDYNRRAWDGLVERGDQWTVPVGPGVIAAARTGNWHIVLTPHRPVPREWFPDLRRLKTLCLAGGGGQQGPVLAAAGAVVTVLDQSAKQLGQDRLVAAREWLSIDTVPGDMRDLGMFPEATFGLIVHPCSNTFVPDVRPVWREAFRVLAPGGTLLAGFVNPAAFLFDEDSAKKGVLVVRHRLPYSDAESLPAEERERLINAGEPLVFSHSLEDLIGGQIDAGFAITGLYEDEWPGQALSRFMPPFIATRARKPGPGPARSP